MDELPRNANWEKLRIELERRLTQDGRETMTIPELELLAGLRLRERYLQVPFYAERDKSGPLWWMALKSSRGALRA